VPDNGGQDITAYQILRSTTSGNEQLIATYSVNSTSKAEYVDATADPTVPDYFYKIIAVNPVGAGVASNEIDLQVVAPVFQTPCIAPGVTLLTDATGDSTNPEPGTDLISASVAQPYGSQNMVFTILTAPDSTAAASKTPGTAWYLAMKVPNGTGGYNYTGVRMEGGPTGPAFYYYTPGANTSGTVDGRFVTSETATTGSYNPTTGVITITVTPANLGLTIGSVIQGFVAGSTQTTDPTNSVGGATEVWDSMPDSLTFTNSYTVVDNATCQPLQSAVSRKVHGSAGTFDINLPLSGAVGEETRGTGTSNNSYSVVLTMVGPVSNVGTASLGQGNVGNASASAGPKSNQITVNLTGVATSQHLAINLAGVQVTGLGAVGNLSVPMDVLVGDVNLSKRTDSGDQTAVRNSSVSVPTASNFRLDVNASGRIESVDQTVVRNVSVTTLP
jgi:hypothetical protein